MALSPLINPDDRITIVQPEIEPSRTYEFDFDKGDFTGSMIDTNNAIEQFVRKALVTARFRYLIYDRDFGSELESLIGSDVTKELLEAEIPRIITEALIYDERIADVYGFTIEKQPGDDQTFVSFFVSTVDGDIIPQEVAI